MSQAQMLNWQFPPKAEDRIPLTRKELVQNILPLNVLYVLMAYLARTQETRPYRLLLDPLALSLTYHAAATFQPSCGQMEYIWMDYGHGIAMFTIAMRIVEWTFINRPLRRSIPNKSHPIWETFDLCFNTRGISWTWSKGLVVPPDSRNTDSRIAFCAYTIVRALLRMIVFDGLHYMIQLWGSDSFGSQNGGSIFDTSLPQPWQYLRATAIASISGIAVAVSLDFFYDTATVILFPLIPDPKRWPPISYKVWSAQSLAEFWGTRWHQSFRRSFIILGAVPVALILGRRVAPIGAFVVSGLLHDVSMWCMGRGIDPLHVFGFFVIMGVGCLLESLWTILTGRRVAGWLGCFWTYAWILGWSNMVADPWLSRGLVGSLVIPTRYRVGKRMVDLIINKLTA